MVLSIPRLLATWGQLAQTDQACLLQLVSLRLATAAHGSMAPCRLMPVKRLAMPPLSSREYPCTLPLFNPELVHEKRYAALHAHFLSAVVLADNSIYHLRSYAVDFLQASRSRSS